MPKTAKLLGSLFPGDKKTTIEQKKMKKNRFTAYEVKMADTGWLSRSKTKTTVTALKGSQLRAAAKGYLLLCIHNKCLKKNPDGTNETH